MKYLDTLLEYFKSSENKDDGKDITSYPMSVKTIFNRFSHEQQESIKDNLEKFAKSAKKLYYNGDREWKDYFQKNDIKSISSLNQICDSMDKWNKK